MQENDINIEETLALKKLIDDFIAERFQNAVKKGKKEIEKLKIQYQPETWLEDAAYRVSQIQIVTHAVKFSNSDAKGSNFYLSVIHEQNTFISTHSIKNIKYDATGNAAALDVYKFLQLSYAGETLLERVLRNDSLLLRALPGTEIKKSEWFLSFANITKEKNNPSSHNLAKQIYFPIDKNEYHVLAPLFPTSLVQALYEQIQTRFEENTKAARKAKNELKFSAHGYREYVNLAVQKFGGTKPQNVSQLNSIRAGKSYLLPSLPPNWKSNKIEIPLKTNSILTKFNYRVNNQIKILRQLLSKTNYNNINIRETRAKMVMQLVDELLFFAAQIQQLPAGWSANTSCKLNEAEKFWLDPKRAEFDTEWAEQKKLINWQESVSNAFAAWLNKKLTTDKLRFGDDEYLEWQKILEHELLMLREAI